MKTLAKLALAVVAVIGLSACASERGWTPVVDTTQDKHASKLPSDTVACKQLADQAADKQGTLLERGGIGALGGAALGAVTGAIIGAPGTGAALGAATGTGAGLGSGAISADDAFKQAFKNCLVGRGHPVIN